MSGDMFTALYKRLSYRSCVGVVLCNKVAILSVTVTLYLFDLR